MTNHRCWTIILTHLILFTFVNCDKKDDEYIVSTRSECFASKRIFSCFKYKTARYIWSIATGQRNYFQQDTNQSDTKSYLNIVQLSKPSENILFPEARHATGVTEFEKGLDFLKRSVDRFLASHGVQASLDSENGSRVFESNVAEYPEARIKKKKWAVILPLIILFKMMKLKMMIMKVAVGVGLIQLLLLVGGIGLIYYLKYNTLCKVQPLPVYSHSHIFEPHEPEIPYSNYANYYQGNYQNNYPSYISGGSKDWSSRKSFSTAS